MRLSSRPALSTVAGIIAIIVIIIVAGVASALILTQGPGTTSSPSLSSASPSSTSLSSSSSAVQTSSTPQTSTASLQKVSFNVGFVGEGYLAPFYYGLDQGLYRQNGIDLSISPGQGDAPTISAVASGKFDFGIADSSSIIVSAALSNVSNIRIVAVWFQKTVFGVVFNRQGILTPADLNGKSMGAIQGGGAIKLFTVFAQRNNINLSSIKITYVQPTSLLGMVPLKKADFIVGIANSQADMAPTAASNGVQLGVFPYAQYGVDTYGFCIFTTVQMINSNPSLVQKFVSATMQSVVAAGQAPSAAIASFAKSSPGINSTLALGDYQIAVRIAIPNINSTGARSNPLTLGWVDSARMQSTIGIIAQAYEIKTPPVASQLYTNQFTQQP